MSSSRLNESKSRMRMVTPVFRSLARTSVSTTSNQKGEVVSSSRVVWPVAVPPPDITSAVK